MLSDLDYKELIKFREGQQRIDDIRSPRLQRQIDLRHLEVKSFTHSLDSYGGDMYLSDEWGLTPSGEDALLEYEKARRQQEQVEKSKKADHTFQLLNTLVGALVGCALTLLVEHFDVIVEIFKAKH